MEPQQARTMMPTVSCLDMVLNPHPKESEALRRVLDGEWNYSFLLSQFLGAKIGWRRGRSCEPGGLKHKGSWEIHTEKTQKRIQLQSVPVDLSQVIYPFRASVSLAVTSGS